MANSPVAYSKDLYWASITVEDYSTLSTARTLTLGFGANATIEEALQKISRRGNVHLQNDIKMFGLYSSKKLLDPNETFQSLGFKLGVHASFIYLKSGQEKISLTLKRNAKTLVLTIVFEGQPVPSITETCNKSDTIQKLIEQLAEKNPQHVNNKDDDSCALFLPTKKSKKGIFLERNKTVKSYHLTNGVRRAYYFHITLPGNLVTKKSRTVRNHPRHRNRGNPSPKIFLTFRITRNSNAPASLPVCLTRTLSSKKLSQKPPDAPMYSSTTSPNISYRSNQPRSVSTKQLR
jgi:hypothetical protein